MMKNLVFELYVNLVFPAEEYFLYGDRTTYGSFVVCVGKYDDADFKSILLHFPSIQDLYVFWNQIDVPHRVYPSPFDHDFLTEVDNNA